MTFATITVTGKFQDVAQNWLGGTVTIVPTFTEAIDATAAEIFAAIPQSYAIHPSSAGFTTAALVTTDSTDLVPSGWAYSITVSLTGLQPWSFSVLLPSALGATADISQLSPVTPVTPSSGSLPVVSILSFGAHTDGVSDSTAAIQAAMNSGATLGLEVFIPGGIIFRVTSLTWNTGQVIKGVYCGTFPGLDTIPTASILARLAGSNEDMIVVPDTVNYGLMEDVMLDGNKNNNTAGYGVNIKDGALLQETEIRFSRCYIQSNPYSNMYLGHFRLANRITNCTIQYSATGDGITVASTDNLITESLIADNGRCGIAVGTTISQNYAAAAAAWAPSDNQIYGNNIWNNDTAVAISSGVDNTFVSKNIINLNSKQGITVYDGATNVITENMLHGNSQGANDTYGHIDVGSAVTSVSISDNMFGAPDSGTVNVASWCVNVGSGASPGTILGNLGTMYAGSSVNGLINQAGSNVSPSVVLSLAGGIVQGPNATQDIFQLRKSSGVTCFSMDNGGTFAVNEGVGKFQAGLSVGNGHSPQSLTANGDTILVPGVTHTPVTATGNYAGTILQPGAEDGQLCTVVNVSTSSGSVTFAASGTSNVYQGTGLTIPIGGKQIFEWDASTSLWY